MKTFQSSILPLLAAISASDAFWRLGCGIAQRGRIDPIITPGGVSGHVHMLSGGINIGPFSNQQSLQAANCTSCTIQADKSAYWTPQLFYQFPNGSYTIVPNGGTIIYYLGRGDDAANIVPFPPNYCVLSGDPFARSYNKDNLTHLNTRPIADRASFACINYDHPSKETPNMANTNCPQGLRAQIQFPSCWDGVNSFLPHSDHVAYMSQIDNGKCPPTHPKTLPHLFFEIYYSVDKFNGQGGRFVFANGDTTGYGFHGDFMNGWDSNTLNAAIKECLVGNPSGLAEQCSVFKAPNDGKASAHCPQAPPLVNEQVEGILPALPGCIIPTDGPERATPPTGCPPAQLLGDDSSAGSAPVAPALSAASPAAASPLASTVSNIAASTNVASAADAAASNVSSMLAPVAAEASSASDAASSSTDDGSGDDSTSTVDAAAATAMAANRRSLHERSPYRHGHGRS
jgi:Domain of unknown function (DUF1996)